MTRGMPELGCRDVVESLGDWVAGELGLAKRAAVDRHVAGCAGCTAYVAGYVDTIRLARDAHAESGSGDALADGLVHAVLSAHARRPPRSGRTRRPS